jgi:hypothetical protein
MSQPTWASIHFWATPCKRHFKQLGSNLKRKKNNYHNNFFKVLLVDETSTINQLNTFVARNVIFCGCIDVEKEGANIFMKAHINIVLLY